MSVTVVSSLVTESHVLTLVLVVVAHGLEFSDVGVIVPLNSLSPMFDTALTSVLQAGGNDIGCAVNGRRQSTARRNRLLNDVWSRKGNPLRNRELALNRCQIRLWLLGTSSSLSFLLWLDEEAVAASVYLG